MDRKASRLWHIMRYKWRFDGIELSDLVQSAVRGVSALAYSHSSSNIQYSPVCKSHPMHHAAFNFDECFECLPAGSKETTLLFDSLLMTLPPSSCLDFFIGNIVVHKETTIMLYPLSPRSIYLVYHFVIAVSSVSCLKSICGVQMFNLSIKDSISEQITKDSWENCAMKALCQNIITHTSSSFLSIDLK